MTRQEYEHYQHNVARFFHDNGITNLSQEYDEDGAPHVDTFSKYRCDCCGTTLAGERHHASGYNPYEQEIYNFRICPDCLYYTTYGRLDDETMLEIEESE